MIVTGIGSRKTPPEVLKDMQRIGEWCKEQRVPLRSGHADGADWAFEQGAQELCIAYIPWASFNQHLHSRARKVLYKPTDESRALVAQVHPAPHKLSQGTWKLHGRNTWQILGSTLDKPSQAVVCWTPKGEVVGGTATAIRLAQERGIPVYNLARTSAEEVLVRLRAQLDGREVRACEMPPQPGDDQVLDEEEGLTIGMLFGRGLPGGPPR